jgi:hypothetical protein
MEDEDNWEWVEQLSATAADCAEEYSRKKDPQSLRKAFLSSRITKLLYITSTSGGNASLQKRAEATSDLKAIFTKAKVCTTVDCNIV